MSVAGYRGGFAPFYEAVKKLNTRGIFDATEVSGFETLEDTRAKVDEMTKHFPRNGEFGPVAVTHHKDNYYIAAYEYDDKIYVEMIEILSGGFTSLRGHLTLNFGEFTYVETGGSSSWFREKRGKFARPTLRDEETSEPTRPVFRRKIFHTSPKDGTSEPVPNNPNSRGKGSLSLPTTDNPQGRGRCCSLRHGDNGSCSIREQEFQSSDSGILPREQGDKSGPAGQELRPDSSDSKRNKININFKKFKVNRS